MGLSEGPEQFTIETLVDGKLIREQRIYDPFLRNKTVVGISRWDLFKALFRKQFTVTVEIRVDGTPGVMRKVMMLDPKECDRETQLMLEDRRKSRESGNCVGYVNECN